MIVLAGMGILGSAANGTLFAMGIITMIGFLAAAAALVYFGIKVIKEDKKDS